MIEEDYVSFETAKLLKEKGFDLYEVREWVAEPQDKSTLERDSFPTFEDFIESKDFIELPITSYHYPHITHQMTLKWIREKFHSFCILNWHLDTNEVATYSWRWEGKHGLSMGYGGGYLKYEDACEAAIRYFLEIVI